MPRSSPTAPSRAKRGASGSAFLTEAGCILLCVAVQSCAHAGSSSTNAASPGAGAPGQRPRETTPAEIANALLDELARQEWPRAVARFDPAMKRALPEAKLRDLWRQVIETEGEMRGVERTSIDSSRPTPVVLVDVAFAKRRQEFRVAVDPGGEVVGLYRGPVPADAQGAALELVGALARGDAAASVARFDAGMRSALTPEQAIAAWRSVEDKSGSFQEVEGVTSAWERGHVVELVRCRMARGTVLARVVFDGDGDVAGLFFLPGEASAWAPPQ